MEAETLHSFERTADDELTFQKGDLLKIMNMENDKNWYLAELNGRKGLVPSNYIKMRQNDWYFGKISRREAEHLLLERDPRGELKQEDGAFILRISESYPDDFSLSVKWEGSVQHFKVLRDGGGRFFLWVVKFDSLNQLIDYHRTSSVSRSQPIYLREYVRDKVKALFDFSPEEDDELSLRKGEEVIVLSRDDENWWTGEVNREGVRIRGVFPKTFVQEISKS